MAVQLKYLVFKLTLFYSICKQSDLGRILATIIWFGLVFSFWMFHLCRTMWNERTNAYRFTALIGIHWMNYEILLITSQSLIEEFDKNKSSKALSLFHFRNLRWNFEFSIIFLENSLLSFPISDSFSSIFSVLCDFVRYCDANLFAI